MRAFTVSVFEDEPNAGSPALTGYIRASQTTQTIQTAQRQLLLGLAMGGGITILLVGAGGLWLTQIALRPVEYSYHQLMQFTADASHELRGPLMAIKASIGVMQRHPERFTPKDIKKLDAIGSATTQLQSLAEDLLLLARMDAEQTTQSPEKVSINRCLRDVVALYGEAAIAKGLELSLLEHEQGFVWGQGRATEPVVCQSGAKCPALYPDRPYYCERGSDSTVHPHSSRRFGHWHCP